MEHMIGIHLTQYSYRHFTQQLTYEVPADPDTRYPSYPNLADIRQGVVCLPPTGGASVLSFLFCMHYNSQKREL